MAFNNNAYQNYKNNSINTASAEQLTLMLYEGAIKFCNRAIMAIEQGNVQEAHNYIMRVERIIEEFQASLKKEYKVSEDFAVMYEYMYRRLVEANINKDVEIINEVLGYLREFRDIWKELMKTKSSAQ